MIRNLFFLFLFLIFSAFSLYAQTEGDRIVAIVGNEIITESDFQYQVQVYARQNQLREISPYLAQQIFQSMMTNKIILAKAEQDSIIVTEDEIGKELDSRLKALIAQTGGSEQRLEEAYGMSLQKIKMLLKEDLEKNMKIEKMRRKKFQGQVKVSDKEVQEFFRTYRDSLPEVGTEFEVSHIFMERNVSLSEKEEAKKIAEIIYDSLKNGADFSELAKRNSDDSLSAIQGGDLGFAKRGSFVKEFEEVLFNLKPGEISEPVETQFGYHIIKLNEKSGDKAKSQHILIMFPKHESSDFETINFLNELKSRIEKNEITFEEAVKQYSQDEFTKDKAGSLGRLPAEQLDSMSVESLKKLSAGQISQPLRVGTDQNYGYEIYKLEKVYAPHKMNLDDDYEKIKKIALSYKENKEVEKWINELRESIYVDIKM